MWPGILSVSRTDFKANATAVVYAHKALVKKYISSLQRQDEEAKLRAEEEKDEVDQADQEGDQATAAAQPSRTVSLSDFIPICSGRMISNGVPTAGKGKAVEIHHHLFDALWNCGTRQIDASILIAQENDGEEGEEEKKEDQTESQPTGAEGEITDPNAPAQ